MTRTGELCLIRNFGIVAHVDAGKTTLTERILYFAGEIRSTGEVHDGNTVTDFDPREQQHGITIQAAAVSCSWRGHRLALIDTPGHVDFTLEVERSLRVLDGAIVVLDAVAGVEAQTETVWRQADRYAVPRIALVNKLDRAGADFAGAVEQIAERLDAEPVVIAGPIGAEADFVGVVDVVRRRALVWREGDGADFDVVDIPASARADADAWRGRLLEICADVSDACAEELLETGDVSEATLVRALREATLAGLVVPVLAGSAYKNRGVQPVLDAVVDYLPSPSDRAAVRDVGSGAVREPSRSAPLSAICFKVVHDDFGQLSFVRVYSGVLRKGTTVVTSRTGRRVRVGRLLRVFAASRQEVDALGAGEIGALVGLRTATGETLSDPADPVVLESVAIPEAVMRLAIEPIGRSDHGRLGSALAQLVSADPSLRIESDPETGQSLLAGLGELHLQIALERLGDEHRVAVRAGKPRVAYREALTRTVEHELRHSKQTGGPGEFAHVILRVEPGTSGAGLEFVDEVRGGDVPRELVSAVRDGIAEAMQRGMVAGYPIVDARVTLLGGSAHSNDSSDRAFRIAAGRAFSEAASNAGGVLLEPVMTLEVTVNEENVGDVIGDFGARRGQVIGIEHGRGSTRRALGEVPLAELFGYAGALRSLTHGRGVFTMAYAEHRPVPDRIAREVVARSA